MLPNRLKAGYPNIGASYLRHVPAGNTVGLISDLLLVRQALSGMRSAKRAACVSNEEGVITAQRHRLHELHRESIIEEALVQKSGTGDRYGRISHQIDLECDLKSENVLTRQTNIS